MISFDVKLASGLPIILNRPITAILITGGPQGRPCVVRLAYADGGIVRIRSEMHHLGERIEIGALEFDDEPPVESETCEVFQLEEFICTRISKLIITESGVQVESGIKLFTTKRSLTLVAGVYPYTLAIFGLPPRKYFEEPEYDLNDYMEVAVER